MGGCRATPRAIFATLAAVPGLALAPPCGVASALSASPGATPIDVAPLATPEARKVFLAVAGKSFKNDPLLDLLVGAQDGLRSPPPCLATRPRASQTLTGCGDGGPSGGWLC